MLECLFNNRAVHWRESARQVPRCFIERRLDRHITIHKHLPFVTTRHPAQAPGETVHTGKIQPAALFHHRSISARNHRDRAIETDHPVCQQTLNRTVLFRPPCNIDKIRRR
jgi:hypothetical protein